MNEEIELRKLVLSSLKSEPVTDSHALTDLFNSLYPNGVSSNSWVRDVLTNMDNDHDNLLNCNIIFDVAGFPLASLLADKDAWLTSKGEILLQQLS